MSHKTARWIMRHIAVQGLGPGDRLPSEHKIAALAKAGRSSVREALQWLRGQGVIEVLAGKGYYLRADAPPSIPVSLPAMGIEEIRDLTDARLVIECACAALAAQRATPADVARVDAFVQAMEAKAATVSSIYRETIRMHLMIAAAAHNHTLSAMLRCIVPKLVAHNARLAAEIPDRAYREFTIHRDLWAQICAGDPEVARSAMEKHIRDAASLYLLAYESPLLHSGGVAISMTTADPDDRAR